MAEKHSIPNESDPLPEEVLQEIAAVFKALGDPTRAQLVYLLTRREYSVNELSELVPVSPSAVSHHLAKLRALRLVRTRREANQIFYSIDDPFFPVGKPFRGGFKIEHTYNQFVNPFPLQI